MEDQFTREDSLAVIRQMIVQAQERLRKSDGFYLLLWGYLVLVASLLHYVLIRQGFGAASSLAWLLMGVGGVVSIMHSRQEERQRTVRTHLDRVVNSVWLAFVICALLVGVMAFSGLGWRAYAVLMVLYGFGLFVTGQMYRLWPVTAGAYVCWAGSLLSYFTAGGPNQLLILAGVVFLGYVLPGHWIRWKGI